MPETTIYLSKILLENIFAWIFDLFFFSYERSLLLDNIEKFSMKNFDSVKILEAKNLKKWEGK